MTFRDASDEIDDAAAAWVAREDRGDLTADEAAALQAWLDADPRRLGAYARAKAVSAHVDASIRPATDMARGKRVWAAAGGVSALVAAVVFWVAFGTGGYKAYATQVGEIQRSALADGSAVTLNTASAVQARMGDERRVVRLIRGEALFEVAADAARPFQVIAGDTIVTAVGTSFSVRLFDDESVEVVVREGVVEVRRTGRSPQKIAANTVLTWASQRVPVTQAESSDAIERAIAWQRGMIDLDGRTLGEAAEEFARYGGAPIRIPDRAVASMTVTGLFSASDPVGFSKAAALSLGLTATEEGDGVTIKQGPR